MVGQETCPTIVPPLEDRLQLWILLPCPYAALLPLAYTGYTLLSEHRAAGHQQDASPNCGRLATANKYLLHRSHRCGRWSVTTPPT
jgi:hypothetical protein